MASQSWVGRRTPYHCTSSGKVLLAFVDERESDRLIGLPLEQLTENTITDAEALRAQLVDVRARGYARTIEELEEAKRPPANPKALS